MLKHRNHDEVGDLVRFALERGLDISFIEEMPLGVIGDHDRAEAYYSSDEIRRDLAEGFELIPTTETTGGPSRYWRVAGSDTGSASSPAQPQLLRRLQPGARHRRGRLLLCLGQEFSTDLRRALRANPDRRRAGQAGHPRGHVHQAAGARLRPDRAADHLPPHERHRRLRKLATRPPSSLK
jgi:cyclic pyranopterin phosphate synthase